MKLVVKKLSKVGIPLFAFILGLTPMFVITAFAEGGATGATGYYTYTAKIMQTMPSYMLVIITM